MSTPAEMPVSALIQPVSEHQVASHALTLLGAADAAVCVDGVCEIPSPVGAAVEQPSS